MTRIGQNSDSPLIEKEGAQEALKQDRWPK